MTWRKQLAIQIEGGKEYKISQSDGEYHVTCGAFGRSYNANDIEYKAAVEKTTAEELLAHGNIGSIEHEFGGTEFTPEPPKPAKKKTAKKTTKKK